MKITKRQLQRIIKEEIQELVSDERWKGYNEGIRTAIFNLEKAIINAYGVDKSDVQIDIHEQERDPEYPDDGASGVRLKDDDRGDESDIGWDV